MPIGLKGNADGSGAIQVGGTDAVTLSTALDTTLAGSLNAPNTFAFKNRIINGAMVIDQRNAGASVTATTAALYTLDRWQSFASVNSKFTIQQNAASVTPPVGFTNYLGITSSAATTVGASDYYGMIHKIEGLNTADLAWGTANAATVTLSFWVRSSLTGTFGATFSNSGGTRAYPFTYTINSANTWEQKSVTVAGDTSGTWLTTNGIGITLLFGLGVGSTYSTTAGAWATGTYFSATGATSVVGTNGATFYITGVQLEKGRLATSFDYRPYGTELQLCQRYLPAFNSSSTTNSLGAAYAAATTTAVATLTFPVQARVAPTGISSTAASTMSFGSAAGSFAGSAVAIGANSGVLGCDVNLTISGATAGQGGKFSFNNATGQLLFTGCEL